MKKTMTFVLTTMFVTFLMSTAYAFNWRDHYNGDPNYPMVWGHTGVATYIDKQSVNVQSYDPPYYIIAVGVFVAPDGGYGQMSHYHVDRFFYNYNTTKMYLDKHPNTGDWEYLYPLYGHGAMNHESMSIGEAAFYTAYNMKFYGAYTWKDANGDQYFDCQGDGFYERIR